jgi:hypothetical protein
VCRSLFGEASRVPATDRLLHPKWDNSATGESNRETTGGGFQAEIQSQSDMARLLLMHLVGQIAGTQPIKNHGNFGQIKIRGDVARAAAAA